MNENPDPQLLFSTLVDELREIVRESNENDTMEEKLLSFCRLLKDKVPYYNWVGIYLVDPSKNELVIGPFVGEPTVHVRIPFGKGLCGQAAERKETVIAQDVTQELNYLSCSPRVKSEIVVPIVKKEDLVGVLDIDAHIRSAFTSGDQEFLETIGKILSALFQNH